MRVNLLPPEVRKARREASLLRGIRFAGLAALFLLAGVYGIRSYEVFTLRGELDGLRAQTAETEAERASLGAVAEARDAAVAGEALASQLLRGEISWSAQLLAVSEVIPPGFSLTSFSGQTSSDTGGTIVGSVTFSAVSRDFIPVQTWLIRIAAEERWANGWVASVGADDGGYGVNGSFDLTTAAVSLRGGGPA